VLEIANKRQHDELVERLLAEVLELHASIVEFEDGLGHVLARVHRANTESARNLVDYVALRRHDLRALQDGLAALGLSSLGRSESHVLDNLDQVIFVMGELSGQTPQGTVPPLAAARGRTLLREHTEALLGPRPRERYVRIMVTLPSEAAADPEIARRLVESGMDVCRINCAHDSPREWQRMIENLHAATRATGRQCRLLMDLAGPKVRTGAIEPGPRVLSWHPRRTELGALREPARVKLVADETPGALPVPGSLLEKLAEGDRIEFEDVRGKKRSLEVVAASRNEVHAISEQTAYVIPGTEMRLTRTGDRFFLGALAPSEQTLRLSIGDVLVLTASPEPGAPRTKEKPARIPLTLEAAFTGVKPGQPVSFDDGRFGGVVEAVTSGEILVRITSARPGGDKLRADKGVNFPETDLGITAITAKDVEDLAFVARHADMVGLSFVKSAGDVAELRRRLAELERPDLGIVLKIETRQAFRELPALLLAVMESPRSGVMIARGDLAVECGWERLAEVQEEILWMCEAAHTPVIWATQVLEGLTKKGRPSRSEITDAAMGERAECVMLNKGPHVASAVRVLDDILRRMEPHQWKKRSMLRALKLARSFGVPAGT
jgi:pyruvate kinase